jgi:hypothetical protein
MFESNPDRDENRESEVLADGNPVKRKLNSRALKVGLVAAVVAALLLGFSLLSGVFTGMGSSACYVSKGHIDAARETSSTINNMGAMLRRSTTNPTNSTLQFAARQLKQTYSPSYLALGQRWLSLESCGEPAIDALIRSMGNDLLEGGDILSRYEYGNTKDLDKLTSLLGRIGASSDEISRLM